MKTWTRLLTALVTAFSYAAPYIGIALAIGLVLLVYFAKVRS